MNRLTGQAAFDHQFEIMQAIKDGKTIQVHYDVEWRDYTIFIENHKYLNFREYEFRIKPEPIEQEYWMYVKTGKRSTLMPIEMGGEESEWIKSGYTKIKMREVISDE